MEAEEQGVRRGVREEDGGALDGWGLGRVAAGLITGL